MLFRSDRKSTRLNSSHTIISYAVFCLKKKKRSKHCNATPSCYITLLIIVFHTVRHRKGPNSLVILLLLIGVSSFWRFFFFFNDTATTEIYTLSLHDALPI